MANSDIQGTVTDQSGNPVQGAVVEVTRAETSGTPEEDTVVRTTTDTYGQYLIDSFPGDVDGQSNEYHVSAYYYDGSNWLPAVNRPGVTAAFDSSIPDSVVSRPDDDASFENDSFQFGLLIETSQSWPSIGARLSQNVSGQTRAYLYRVSDDTLIRDVDISGLSALDTFTFDDVDLSENTQYTVVVGAEGANMTHGQYEAASFPYTSSDSNLQIVDNAETSSAWDNNDNAFNILEVGNVGISSSTTVFDDIESLSLEQTFDLSSISTNAAHGMFVRDDGSQMWINDRDNGVRIMEFTLSTPWDVSTASLANTTPFDQDPQPIGITIADGGSKLYVCDLNSSIHEYDLSTAYDITTKSLNQTYTVNYLSEIHPLNIEFYENGTRALIGMGVEDDIVEFSLSAAYDLSTLSQEAVYDPQNDITGDKLSNVRLLNNNNNIIISWGGESSTNDLLANYDLGTSGDPTTASLDGTKDLSANASQVQSAAVKPDGTRVFVADDSVPQILEYRI